MAVGEQGAVAGPLGVEAPQRYTRVAIVLHWLVALALFGQIGLGWFLDTVPRGTPDRTVWVNLHKSTGLVLGALVLVRLVWRLTHRPPPLPLSMPRWERVAASANHALLYACLIGMPLAGYLASNHSRFGIRFFGIPLAPWGADDRALYALFNGIHGALSWLLVGLITLHLMAAAKHVFIDRDAILKRMWRD
jgi:cytochrome b561